ncbi:MAG: DUF2867 domain-containing protein [Gemmatimonadota bacterium]|nr:DUF2867 domain-containing protein [Gemmatimonadota bacterium]
MRPWGRATEAEYRARRLLAHDLLAGVPLHDAWRVFLPGGARPCSMPEVRSVARALVHDGSLGLVVPALFGIRRRLGAWLGWDGPVDGQRPSVSMVSRVPERTLADSLVPPGSRDGPFSVVYVAADEAMSEIRNATVEAYLVSTLRPVTGGCELLFAVHVLPVGIWTRPYLALIAPFRRLFVYPALLKGMHQAWQGAKS